MTEQLELDFGLEEEKPKRSKYDRFFDEYHRKIEESEDDQDGKFE